MAVGGATCASVEGRIKTWRMCVRDAGLMLFVGF